MPARSSYAAGTPCWVDHAGPDPDAARAFYGPLFGWEFAIGGPETGHYTLARKGVKNVAGLVGIPVTGHPPAWTTYFATDDADELGARVVANGGTLVMEPMQVGDAGSMLLWVDPLEVVAGGWQAGARIGAELVNEPGTVVWNELVTPNLDVAVAFYSALLPVTGLDIGDETFRYQTLQVDGREVCGVYEAPPGVSPHWAVYFSVEDVDSTVYRAIALGASITRAAMDSPFGRHATLTDSQGAAFSVITPPADLPARG